MCRKEEAAWPRSAQPAQSASFSWGPSHHQEWGTPLVQVSVHLAFMLLTSSTYRTLTTLARSLGPVFRLRLLHTEMVILSGEEVLKSAFSRTSMDARPPQAVLNLLYCGSIQPRGIILNWGKDWKNLRRYRPTLINLFTSSVGSPPALPRFTVKALKDCGFGQASMEERILEESLRLEEVFGQAVGKDEGMSVNAVFNKAALNVIWGMVAGERYSYDDGKKTSPRKDVKGPLNWSSLKLKTRPVTSLTPKP